MSHPKKARLTGYAAWDAAYAAVDHEPLLRTLGVTIPDEQLRLALTHRSFAHENGNLPNNERLEFVGDAVLGLSIAGALFEKYPARPESDISKMRAGIVSRYGCADVAREINLGTYILLGKGELATDGRDKLSILADTTEAVLGAVYLEHGFDVARDVVLRLFAHKIATASSEGRNQDWKTTLQERLSAYGISSATYRSHSSGPEHDLVFTADISIAGIDLGRGTGHNKKLAEQEAAHQAYLALGNPETVHAVRAADA
ncbi:ribonuclease III [Corynebacterium uberis]|uniref:ribonuclease III n=1 Tax=Corynebacterium uberis TaxID=2883169 RepID=UPI001D0B160A|nr:ribonuclease III [Corynebacterium uberis]UDL81694.1 ribonuclease III [Corynebacterium uberis]